ncbi:MAG: arsenate reductase [Moraxellaceae bacterium]
MVTLYGIKNCDTMKKAMAWLTDHGIAYTFHDYTPAGAPAGLLSAWEARLGWETLLNRRGTTWRKLPADVQAGIDRERALLLMQQQPSLIRRPVLDTGRELLCGFDPDAWQHALRPA